MRFIYLKDSKTVNCNDRTDFKKLQELGEILILEIEVFQAFDSMYQKIEKEFKTVIYERIKDEIVILGSLMGGYWGAVFANKFGLPAILMNPVIDPKCISKERSAKSNKIEEDLEINNIPEYITDNYPKIPESGKFLILSDVNDEIINADYMDEYFKNNQVIKFENGNYCFKHLDESIPHIEKFLNYLESIHY